MLKGVKNWPERREKNREPSVISVRKEKKKSGKNRPLLSRKRKAKKRPVAKKSHQRQIYLRRVDDIF